MEGDAERVRRAAAKVGQQVGSKTRDKLKSMSDRLLKEGALPKDVMGVDDSMAEALYGQAHNLYSHGKYRDALQLFKLLISLNSTESKYVLGQAACFHMMRQYAKAVQSYEICAMLDPGNPIPHYHASDCHIKLKNKLSAMIALEIAIERAADKPQFATIKQRALLTVDGLRKEFIEEEQQAAARPPQSIVSKQTQVKAKAEG